MGVLNNVFLVGFMGSGKTAVGRALARRLGWRFVDTDAEVERAARRSIQRIFERSGERAFRRLEAAAVARAAAGSRQVVAAGGGAVLRSRNVAAMRRSGTVVYLKAAVLRSWRRAEKDGAAARPLLASGGRGPAARLRAFKRLLARRRPLYRAAADLAVLSSKGPAVSIARRLAARLERLRRLAP